MTLFKLYKDQALKHEIADNKIHFGKVYAGASKKISIFISNTSNTAHLENLKFLFPKDLSKYLTVIEAPKFIPPNESRELILEWKPSLEFKKALSVKIEIVGDEIYYADR